MALAFLKILRPHAGWLAVFALIAAIWATSRTYAFRNGAEEALNDIEAGRPAKLYWHPWNTIGPGTRTPGLYCPQPGGLPVRTVEIPSAAWGEGSKSWSDNRRGEEARAFAYLYNMTMYRVYGNAWKRSCPGLVAVPYEPVF